MEDEVSFKNKYSLIATINHSGTLNRGHYWAFIKDLHSSTWYSSRFFQIFLWFCKGVLSFQTRSLGVTTAHINPVLTGIEFAHSIFRHCNPAVLSFGEAMQGGLMTKHGLVYEE